MELPVAAQLRELEMALAAGWCLALLYDLLRPLRRGRVTTALTDGFWCLLLFCTLMLFALWVGRGRLRIFAVTAMCFSGGLWFGLFSQILRRFRRCLLYLVRKREKTEKTWRKCKKVIAIIEKSDTII